MKCPVEVRCIVCHLTFCCAECRWKHEQTTHGLQYDCPICRGYRFLCRPEELNPQFVRHLTREHLPLQCRKCNKIFNKMEDLSKIDECVSISELIDKEVTKELVKSVDDKFNSILVKTDSNEADFEAIVSVDKTSKTAVITPIVRKKYLVDYESSDGEDDSQKAEVMKTPYAKLAPKTPKAKKQRAVTPHVKKLLLMRQKVVEEYDDTGEDADNDTPGISKTTPLRNEDNVDTDKEMTTPTSHIPHLMKLAQVVTTSTPTHPAVGGWSLFTDQGADSPLSEIENGESPAQSTVNEPSSKGESTLPPKLKSIIVTGSKLRLGSQDSSEKQVTFQDSVDNSSAKTKRVKFADDTVFEQEPKVKRVYRKPKRMLTPGPQRPKYCCNPRFQALINRFEHQGITVARTPVNRDVRDPIRDPPDSTPPIGEHSNMPARAINFKEDSPVVDENYSKDSNELFKTCVDSPAETKGINNAITALTANIAGSLQNCLSTALKTNEEETEIQFKFVITKKKVSVKRIVEAGEGVDEKSSEIERGSERDKENIWSTVAKAVRTVFWGEGTNLDAETPHRSFNSTGSSATKRKCEEMSDCELSPLNHKRHKYEGRIRGRPPLRRSRTWVSSLRSSQSADHQALEHKVFGDYEDTMNQSF
ncbi:uncharacterized protein LOC126373104 [Pectinophora gossypiella]|uniref:uncharacterized protein LOC126373104 n=1 Tax=Pectinophora gossypiella TaxID=13191 RepID=UPI00214E4414|nr:uncharacterized protein LOC126373104 [Pectinophora gossypiella]